jgi:hypothetical protein
MRIIKTLGAAFLLVGTGGAILSFGAYNDNNFSYRSDGMIMINGEVFYPVGVYFIPLPDQRIRGPAENPPEGTFLHEIWNYGRGFCFDEFGAGGGNFVLFPCFHTNLPNLTELTDPEALYWFEHFVPCDLTDYHPGGDQCTPDLQAALAAGIQLITCHNLGYSWGEGDPYKIWGQAGKRTENSRTTYFNTVKGMVEASEAEGAFFGWWGFSEPLWRGFLKRTGTPNMPYSPTYDYVNDVCIHIKQLEAGASANHPVYLEECVAAIVADSYREYHTGCDILGYNVRIFPAPFIWNNVLHYNGINNRWASITGDTADVQFCSVDGAKPVICCVDAIWARKEGIYYFPNYHQLRFMTYDAVIHRVNGLLWGMWHYVFPPTKAPEGPVPDDEVEERLKPVIREVGTGVMAAVLKAPFDDTLVEAIVRHEGDVVERTAIVGGDLAPKNHICSGRYLMEGCAKLVTEEVGPGQFMDFVYFVAACREGRDSLTGEPVNEYQVTFKPFFSGDWLATYVLRIEPDGTTTQLPVVNGAFTDTFIGEDVNIYKFQKPPRFGES